MEYPFIIFECEKSDVQLPFPFHMHWERRTAGYHSFGKNRQNDDHCIFHYCLSGRGCVRYRNKVYSVLPGSGFLGLIDDIDYFYPEDGTEDWCFWWFGYRGGNYRIISQALTDKYGPIFPLPPDDNFITRMQLLSKKQIVQLNAFEGASLVHELLGILQRHMEQNSFLEKPELVQKTVVLIQNSQQILRISEIADRFKVSREHLSRVFQNTMKQSLQSYIEERCGKQAEKLLLTTSLSIAEIAERCGYQSASSFVRMFQKKKNITPAKYRLQSLKHISLGNIF